MLYVAGDWTLLACSLATVLAVAGCNVSRQASDTGGVDLMAADAGLCPRGLVIASSDYTSTNVSLATAAGVVVSESILSSASAPPGLTTALSGDVVLPTAPSRSGRIVLVDRYPNAVLTWVDPKAAKVEKQLSVGTGFAANPHDYLEIGNKAYVSRYESNPNPGAQPNDSGGDLLVLDPSAPAVTGRVVLASPGDGSLLPRADRMLEVGGEVWVVLQRFDADFKTAGDARIAGVSPESDAVVWTAISPVSRAAERWRSPHRVDSSPCRAPVFWRAVKPSLEARWSFSTPACGRRSRSKDSEWPPSSARRSRRASRTPAKSCSSAWRSAIWAKLATTLLTR